MNKWQDITDMEVSEGGLVIPRHVCSLTREDQIPWIYSPSTAGKLALHEWPQKYSHDFFLFKRILNPCCRCGGSMSRDRPGSCWKSVRFCSYVHPLLIHLGLGKWVRIPTTYAGGAKGWDISRIPPGCAYLASQILVTLILLSGSLKGGLIWPTEGEKNSVINYMILTLSLVLWIYLGVHWWSSRAWLTETGKKYKCKTSVV